MLLLLAESAANAFFEYCDTTVSCFDRDTELQVSRLVDVDPCQNMFGHVCGRWESMYPGQQDQFDVLNTRLRMSLLENSGQARIGSDSAADKIIGTPSKLRSDVALNSYYRHVPKYNAETKFVVWFLEAHRAVPVHKKQFLRRSPEAAVSVSTDDWEATEISVGAFYVILYHLIYTPGSILIPPLLHPHGPNSYNYGSIGKVQGHELSHAFESKHLDMVSNDEDQAVYAPRFQRLLAEQQDCLMLQANKMTRSDIAGNNSISETFADNAGVEAAFLAYSTLQQPDRLRGIGQYTADQAFFAASCYIFCEAKRTSSEDGIYLPHSLRCNQPFISSQEFADAFHCREGLPMFPSHRCDIHDRQLVKHSMNH
ncbi:hypothetical protein V5799_010985 [Amblyomma americanum]|uniref:Peptidase M13 C-terminal domain-containing protein n=1 Tax=Amblyomma americanum TaxID=6943 RepID=A0AAQ4EIG6_AMBAM